MSVLVSFALGGFEVGFDFGLEGLGEHLPRSLAGDLVEVEHELLLACWFILMYASHRCVLPADVASSAIPFGCSKGRYTTSLRRSSIHNF